MDRFDEMAREIGRKWEGSNLILLDLFAAALRDTDAKAREEERERCLAAVERVRERCRGAAMNAVHGEEHEFATHAYNAARSCVAAIREGANECGKPGQPHICADECGTCGTCGSVGTIRVHDPEDCSLYEDPVTRSHFDEYGKCNRCYPRRAPCPACQGGDDAE